MDLRDSPHYRPDAPGARLDDQPWARSWPEFLAAVYDERDASARTVIRDAWTERIPSEGGFLVPEQLRAQVMSYVTPRIVRPRAAVVPMGSLVTHIPVLDNPSQAAGSQALGGLTFSFVADGDAIPSSTPGLGRMRLEAQKLAALVAVPNELNTDAARSLGDLFSRVVAIGLAWAEDDFFIGNGTGAGQPQAIISAPCAANVTRVNAGEPPVAADVAAMLAALHPASLATGLTPGITDVGWLVSAGLVGSWLQMFLNVGGSTVPADVTPVALPSWLNLGDGHEVGPSILGLPAFVTDHQPAPGSRGDLAIADLRNYLIGDRMELIVDRSSAGSGFVSDVTNYRFRSRLDGRYWISEQTTTESGETVSPVVVLN